MESTIAWKALETSWQLEYEETQLLESCLGHYTDPTPRNLRVFTIRFLLAKKLMEQELSAGGHGWAEWHQGFEGKRWLALKLVEYSTEKTPAQLDEDLEAMRQGKTDLLKSSCFGEEFEWPKAFVCKALKILAMVVAY